MKDFVTSLTRQFLPQLGPEERRMALKELQRIIDENMFDLALGGGDGEGDPRSCPRCECAHVVKRGRDASGSQRRLCRGCGRSFTSATNAVFATTKLDRDVWMRFAQCHIDLLTLRESAERCGVSLKAAFFMRHRILEAVFRCIPSFRAQSGMGVEMDECYVPECFKGNRRNSECASIPRKPRKRTEPCDLRERICILTGINDAGDIFYEIVGRGEMSERRATEALSGRIGSGAIVATDGANAYVKALKAQDVRKHIATKAAEHGINRVNALHSRLMEFLDGFHGVATRRPANYLAWFKWIWSFKVGRSAEGMANLMVKQVASSPYKTTWRACKDTPYPFYDYWEKQAKWDEQARKALLLARCSGRVSIAG